MRGRLQTMFKPRMVYVQAGPWAVDAARDVVADSFAAWCAGHVGERCVIGLSSECLLQALVSVELNEQEALAQAVQQWAHYMDVDGAELEANWLLRRVTVAGQHLVSAAPAGLVATLTAAAKAHAVRLAWVGPWWAHGVQNWLDELGYAADLSSDADGAVVTLQAREPGLTVHVQAAVAKGQAARLQRLWIERHERASRARADVAVELTSPQQLGFAVQPHHAHVWDQPQLMAVLRGDASVWGPQP